MTRHVVAIVAMLTLSPAWVHAQNPRFTVSTASANIHRSPSTGSPVIGTAPRGSAFEVVRELGSWVRISWPAAQDGVGYLHVTWGAIDRGAAPVAIRVAATTPAPPVPASSSVSAEQQTGVRPNAIPSTPSLPSHIVGVGARIGSSAFGVAGSVRAWSRGRLGLQVEAARSSTTDTFALQRATSMAFTPSIVFALPDQVANAVWLRPYVGSGAGWYRTSLSSVTPVVGPSVSASSVGVHAFGGGEVTFAAAPWLALSVELGHVWADAPYSAFPVNGTAFSVSGHWYVK